MRRPSNARYLTAAMLTSLAVGSAHGGVIEFTDKEEWVAAVGDFTTIGFTGFPDGTFITNQYADLGVLFTGGNENIFLNENGFPNDGAGLNAIVTPIVVEFDKPQAWIAVDYPGGVGFELYSGDELIYTSSSFGGAGVGFFAGLLSTEVFDRAVIFDRIDADVNIDDLHFGVPAPSTLGLFALGSLCCGRRRRRIG